MITKLIEILKYKNLIIKENIKRYLKKLIKRLKKNNKEDRFVSEIIK